MVETFGHSINKPTNQNLMKAPKVVRPNFIPFKDKLNLSSNFTIIESSLNNCHLRPCNTFHLLVYLKKKRLICFDITGMYLFKEIQD